MSRHRDVRNMDYSDDYDGYDDVYGHSVDDDYYISPSNRQFLYNRENSGQSRSGEMHPMEQDIQEEDEIEEDQLSDGDREKLESCLEYVRSTIDPITVPRQELVKIIIDNKFDCEKTVNVILHTKILRQPERKEKGDTIFNHIESRNNLKSDHAIFPRISNMLSTDSKTLPMLELNSMHVQSATKYNSNSENNFKKHFCKDDGIDCVDGSLLLGNLSEIPSRTINVSPSVSFISKIKNTDALSNKIPKRDLNVCSSLFSKKLSMDEEHSLKDKLNSTNVFPPTKLKSKVNSPAVSFICKISHPTDITLDSEGNSTNSTAEHSPHFDHLISSKQSDVSNVLENISKHFANHMSLKKQNEDDEENLRKKTFLNRIQKKQSKTILTQSQSDILRYNAKGTDISKGLSRLKLTEVKSLPTFKENIQKNNFKIDLTSALKMPNIDTFQSKSVPSNDLFEMPFIACDNEPQLKNPWEEKLMCNMDISHLAIRKMPNFKKSPSSLAKLLCLKYSIKKFKVYSRRTIKLDPSIVKFDFSVPSPDDKILRHLRRVFD